MELALQVRVDRIAAGGAGVARMADGRVVFVHRTAPGDLAEIELTRVKKRWTQGKALRVVEPGPARRAAPCPHYELCGGCTLQHLEYEAQLEAKRALASDALARIGGLDPPPGFAITGSPLEFRYRNRVSFSLRRLGRSVVAGFRQLERPAKVLDVDERCLLPEPALAAAWGQLRRSWGRGAALLPAGDSLRLTLRATVGERVSLLVTGGLGRGEPDELLRRVPSLAAVWLATGPQAAPSLLAGSDELMEVWGEEEIALGGTVFLQVNRAVAGLLEAHVLALAGDVAGRRVVDCYCGAGWHARRLARTGAMVVGIELDEAAVRQARRDAPAGAVFEQGRVEAVLPARLPADLVILNPPRGGTHPAVVRALQQSPPGRIIYVSCDPATLARDLGGLANGFVLRSLRCFDLFPQTAHVETVAELTCATT